MTRRKSTIPADYFTDHEREVILHYIDQGKENLDIAALCDVPETYVRDIRAEFYPTTGLATRIFKAKAAQMAETIVREGAARDLIDVLSRPNMGVLDPVAKAGQKTGILISTNVSDLGGVQVAVAIQQGDMHGNDERALPGAPDLSRVEPTLSNLRPFPRRTLAAGDAPLDARGDAPSGPRVLDVAPETSDQRQRDGRPRGERPRPASHGKSGPTLSPQGRRGTPETAGRRDARRPDERARGRGTGRAVKAKAFLAKKAATKKPPPKR